MFCVYFRWNAYSAILGTVFEKCQLGHAGCSSLQILNSFLSTFSINHWERDNWNIRLFILSILSIFASWILNALLDAHTIRTDMSSWRNDLLIICLQFSSNLECIWPISANTFFFTSSFLDCSYICMLGLVLSYNSLMLC